MNRRRWLGRIAAGGAVLAPGCLSSQESGCPSPTIGQELAYEQRRPSAAFDIGEEGIRVVDSSEGVARFDDEHLDPAVERWARETRFDEQVVAGLQVGSSVESSPLKILGVERDTTAALHVYSCIEEKGATDDWAPYASVLRVPFEGTPPESATLTHWEAGAKRTLE